MTVERIRQTSMKPEGVSKHRKNIAHAHARYPAEKRLQHHSHSRLRKHNQERDYLEKGHSLGNTQKEREGSQVRFMFLLYSLLMHFNFVGAQPPNVDG